MTLRLHNTLTGTTEEFQPLEGGLVRIYTCGPTVWDHSHVGNFRAFLFYDLLRRHLQVSGLRVEQVMNITDVDDRIIEQADRAGTTIGEYTRPYEEAFFADLAALRAHPVEWYPRATGHVEEMMILIERLLASGNAYSADGDVYFRIASFPAYGALSHLDRAGLREGGGRRGARGNRPAGGGESPPRVARVSSDKYEKESASDFALWKRATERDERVGAVWEAPFGRGRPGWHIECSAMAMRYLGETLDIHAGGVDLLFPHHENEVAQSEAATGHTFARTWLHSEHVADATGAKMSKSAGGFTTLRDLVAAGHDPVAVRMFLLGAAHYRSKLRLSEEALHGASEQVRRLRELADRLRRLEPGLRADDAGLYQSALDARDAYREALDDDLNLPAGLGHVFELVREANAALDEGRVGPAAREALLAVLADVDAHLDVLPVDEVSLGAAIQRLIEEREAARRARDYETADGIRARLLGQGVQLEDSREGVRWKLVRK